MSTDAVPPPAKPPGGHIRLTSHSAGSDAPALRWGAPTAAERGPLVGTTTKRAHRNVIGTHSGAYGVYRALAVAAGKLSREHRADLTNTAPTDIIGPHPQWADPETIVSLDPWGAMVADVFAREIADGVDIRPTIAVTKAQVILPEVHDAIGKARLIPDGRVLLGNGAAQVTKAAIEPVWYLPGVARRFGCSETDLRRALFEETGGMYPELVTRSDLDVFLPPISLLVGSTLVNLFYILKHGAQGGNYATLAAAQADGAVVIAYGKTFQAVINFAAALVILYVLYRAMLCFVVKPPRSGCRARCFR